MKRIEVAAGLIMRGKRFLIAQRPPGDSAAGLWEFPGGKLEQAETAADALKRELEEELGICVLATRPLLSSDYDYPDFGVRLHFLQVTGHSGEPVAREGQTLAWVDSDEAAARPFLPADAPLLAKCLQLLKAGDRQA